jgi:ribosomal protein RSM22 (predicted rRNA methylase)
MNLPDNAFTLERHKCNNICPPGLPEGLRRGIDALLHGVSRRALAVAAKGMTKAYAAGHASASAVASEVSLLAYLTVRLPATYAAAIAVFGEVRQRAPDFMPHTLLDGGAGPGTASWAATRIWPSLDKIIMLEPLSGFRALAEKFKLLSESSVLRAAQVVVGDLRHPGALARVDVVVLNYVLAEIPSADLDRVLSMARAVCEGLLIIIEPGTPAGFERIRAARAILTAAGASILGPCPHTNACPILSPDWCHFAVRLPRLRDHKLVKRAELAFEDEKFSYIAATLRNFGSPAKARVLARPKVSAAEIGLKLCTPRGVVEHRLSRRNRLIYKAAKKFAWGDAYEPPSRD